MAADQRQPKKNFTILHISDLHRSATDPISNEELISALIGDRARYLNEDPAIPVPDAIVVSGDLIQGVPLGTADYSTELDRQYAVAEEFIVALTNEFLGGDRTRVVIIPGNHDVDWNTSFLAMREIPEAQIPSDLAAKLALENSDLRWDWKTRKLYRITDRALYAQRLAAFWNFFNRFYAGTTGLLRVQRDADVNLYELCGGRIAVAAFNSCDGNDCFAFHGMIPRRAIATSHLDLNATGKPYDLRLAVWHHNIAGPPYRNDYMDPELVMSMIGRDYRLGLYGHHHKAQIAAHQIYLPDQERMAVVSAGSLCAGRYDLPTGIYRQYNLIEIGEDFTSVRVHVRAMELAGLFAPHHLTDFGGRTYAELDWKKPRNAVGDIINTGEVLLTQAIEKAELALKTGDPGGALEVLTGVRTPPSTYQRRIVVEAATATQDWRTIIATLTPPDTVEELLLLVHAHSSLKEFAEAEQVLTDHAQKLELPADIAADRRNRIAAQLRISQ